MSQRPLTLGHSPDPDDAFMFYGLAKELVPTHGFRFEHILQDIQTLNERATRGELDISAISIHAYAHVSGQYALLPSGASMGDGYGPMLVAKNKLSLEDILRRSDLDWTVVRSAGLFEAGHVSSYQVSDGQLDGVFTSREDLADCLLAQVSDSRFVRKTIEVTTSEGAPTLWQMIRREAFKKS